MITCNNRTSSVQKEAFEREMLHVVKSYTKSIDLVGQSVKTLKIALRSVLTANSLAMSSSLSKYNMSPRLEMTKTAKILSLISSDLIRKTSIARNMKPSDLNKSTVLFSDFLLKVDKLTDHIIDVENSIPSIKDTDQPFEIKELIHAISMASSVMTKLSSRLNSKTRITSKAISDSIRSSRSEFD